MVESLMELGTFQPWFPHLEEHYEALGIKWFGVGYSTDEGSDDIAATLVEAEKVIAHGGKPFIKWVTDPQYKRDDRWWGHLESGLRLAARELPVKHWEIFSEPNCPFVTRRELLLNEYFEVLSCAYATLKEEDPNIQVWNGGMGFFRTMWGLADFLEGALPITDALNLHPFMFGSTWGHVAARISNLLLEGQWAMEVLHQKKPIICTEWGACTEWRGAKRYEDQIERAGVAALSLEGQAQLFWEVLSQFEAIGCPIFCFATLQDAGGGTTWQEHTSPIDPEGNPKPSYEVIKAWAAAKREPTDLSEDMKKIWTL